MLNIRFNIFRSRVVNLGVHNLIRVNQKFVYFPPVSLHAGRRRLTRPNANVRAQTYSAKRMRTTVVQGRPYRKHVLSLVSSDPKCTLRCHRVVHSQPAPAIPWRSPPSPGHAFYAATVQSLPPKPLARHVYIATVYQRSSRVPLKIGNRFESCECVPAEEIAKLYEWSLKIHFL